MRKVAIAPSQPQPPAFLLFDDGRGAGSHGFVAFLGFLDALGFGVGIDDRARFLIAVPIQKPLNQMRRCNDALRQFAIDDVADIGIDLGRARSFEKSFLSDGWRFCLRDEALAPNKAALACWSVPTSCGRGAPGRGGRKPKSGGIDRGGRSTTANSSGGLRPSPKSSRTSPHAVRNNAATPRRKKERDKDMGYSRLKDLMSGYRLHKHKARGQLARTCRHFPLTIPSIRRSATPVTIAASATLKAYQW